MGDRRQVHVTYPNGSKIYFYSHWGGCELPKIVAQALDDGRARWDDPPYLARVVFNHITLDDPEGITGYGISTDNLDSDYGSDDDIHLHLSYGSSGRVGLGAADQTYEDFIREHKE